MTDDTFLPFSFPAVATQESHSCLRWRSPDLGWRRDASGDGRAASRLGRAACRAVFPIGAIRRGSCTPLSICSAPACSRSAAATRTPTTSISLRSDPAFKLACGRLPDTGGICVRSRRCRGWRMRRRCATSIRLTYALVDPWMAQLSREPPRRVTLDIDDTCDVVHGHQQLSLFNAHYDERCFLPIHVYDTETSRPVAVVLRPGKTPSGVEVRAPSAPPGPAHPPPLANDAHHVPRRRPLRSAGGDGRGARTTASTTSSVCPAPSLSPRKVDEVADDIRTERAVENKAVLRGYRRDAPQGKVLEARAARRRPYRGDDARPRHPLRRHQPRARLGRVDLRQPLLRARPGREPDQAAQDTARLRSHQLPFAIANQVRLVLHTAAYWLMLTVRDAIPTVQELATAEFARCVFGS